MEGELPGHSHEAEKPVREVSCLGRIRRPMVLPGRMVLLPKPGRSPDLPTAFRPGYLLDEAFITLTLSTAYPEGR
jgi:hypothetical protein